MEYNWEAATAWKEMDFETETLSCFAMDDMFNYYKSKHGLQFYFPNLLPSPAIFRFGLIGPESAPMGDKILLGLLKVKVAL